MSDQAQGPGWWIASDGKWYPPDLHPDSTTLGPSPTRSPESGPPPGGLPRWWPIAVLGALLAVALGFAFLGDNGGDTDQARTDATSTSRRRVVTTSATFQTSTTTSTTTTLPPTTTTTIYVNPPSMSMDEFQRIETGMTYTQVVDIVGGPGELVSETEIAGYHGEIYMWDGTGSYNTGANANVQFQDGRVIGKAQAGLR